MSNCEFVEYDEKFLNTSWDWLNDPDIKYLTDTPNFTRQSQQDWFKSLSTRDDYFIRGVQFDGKPVGVVGLKKIVSNSCEYWGYIGCKEYWGRGIGKKMLAFAIEEARRRNIPLIYLHVIKDNVRAIKLYEHFEFVVDYDLSDSRSFYMFKILSDN